MLSIDGDPFPGRAGSIIAFQFCYCELSLKNHRVGGRYRKPNFVIYVVWSALIAGVWVVAWSRKYCLGSTEIASFVCLVLFKDGGNRVSPRFHLFTFDANQGNEEAE